MKSEPKQPTPEPWWVAVQRMTPDEKPAFYSAKLLRQLNENLLRDAPTR
jgi:hypothetical protein